MPRLRRADVATAAAVAAVHRQGVGPPPSARPQPGSRRGGPDADGPRAPSSAAVGAPSGRSCSMKATCRQEFASSMPVLSNDMPSRSSPSSGTAFHSLHATSHALQPMQTLVSVKNPIRGAGCSVARVAAPGRAGRRGCCGHGHDRSCVPGPIAVSDAGRGGDRCRTRGAAGRRPGAPAVAVDVVQQRPGPVGRRPAGCRRCRPCFPG